MEYEKKLGRKIALGLIMFILGICAIIISFYLNTTAIKHTFSTGYLMGTGSGLGFGGILIALRTWLILRDKNKLKEHRIENEDERNQLLGYKASHYSLMICVFGAYIASFYFAFKNETVLLVIVVVISFLILTKFIVYFIMKKLV